MNTASLSSHDPAPLLLVKSEIDRSHAKARENLDTANTDSVAFEAVASNLHQVTGALLMVGLVTAARVSEEAEKLVATLKACGPSESADRVQVIKQAISSMSTYLDGLIDGNTDRPMVLARSYLLLSKARGAESASAHDLFLPDLSAATSVLNSAGMSPQDAIPVEAISRCRAIFQEGLLKLMRNKDLVGGANHMCDAILAIEALDASSPSRDFWFTTIAFFDSVVNDPIGARPFAVPLFGKIDQQIRRLMDGDHNVPEKVFRDLLLVIGKSAARTKRTARIRQLYRLDDLLWFPDSASQSAPDEKLIPVVDALRKLITGMKGDLQLFAEGHVSALKTLADHAATIAKFGQQLPNREMVQLLHLLGAVGAHLTKKGSRPTVAQELEIATALLFAESSLDDYFHLTDEFGRQALRTCSRIKNVMTGVELPDFNTSVASLADTKTLQAQTQLLVNQVGQEVQTNLAQIESALDGFFRDASKKDGLASIEGLFSQVRGAFSIIEESEAASLAKLLAERVARFATGEVPGEGVEADMVAEGVSALGLYVTGLQQGSPDAYAKLVPTLARFGVAEKPSPIIAQQPSELHADSEAVVMPAAGKPTSGAVSISAQMRQRPPQSRAAPPETVVTEPEEKVISQKKTQPLALVPIVAVDTAHPVKAALVKPIDAPAVVPTAPQRPPAVAANREGPNSPDAAGPKVTQAGAANSVTTIAESTRLEKSLAELTALLEERDQRIRSLQAQMVSLHREAREAVGLRAELKNLRAVLASLEAKAR